MIDLGTKLRTTFNVQIYAFYHANGLKCFAHGKCAMPVHTMGPVREVDGGNLVVTAGLNALLDATFKTGIASPAWFVMLKNTGSVVAGDTMSSHAGWTENVTYGDATRQAFTPGTIAGGSVDNSAAKAVFNINGTTTLFGAGLTDGSAKSGTTGILYGAGDFASSQAVNSGDIVNVQITLTATG